MKRVGNLYREIVDIKKIQYMYDRRIRINTKNKLKLEKFENNYVSNIIYIKNILESKNYVPGKYNIFLIKEPKLRIIMSQNIIDKIINHMISEYFLVKILDKKLINENIATRETKGTHYGIKLLKKYLNEIKLKHKQFYILKFDISKYFYNIDHDILKILIRKYIKDKDVIKIIDDIIESTNEAYINRNIQKIKQNEINKILDNNKVNNDELIKEINKLPEYKKGKGLPIGNMSSQVLAILYLNELDHYIKEKLNIKYYIRYMDDGILIHENKDYLKNCLDIIIKILDRYKLKLNNKTKIINISEGFEFLGFRYLIKNDRLIMKVKNQTKRKFKRKIKKLNQLVSTNEMKYKDYLQVKNSYLGHLQYGHTKNLINNTLKKYSCLKKIEIEGSECRIVNNDIIYK